VHPSPSEKDHTSDDTELSAEELENVNGGAAQPTMDVVVSWNPANFLCEVAPGTIESDGVFADTEYNFGGIEKLGH
jgi:hypothetical protein